MKIQLPTEARLLLQEFAPAFAESVFERWVILLLGAILTTGRHTIQNILRTVGPIASGHFSSYHRVFSMRRWAMWRVARILASLIIRHWVPKGDIFLAGDDTVDEHRGKNVYGKGCHRDAVRSTQKYTAYRWGHQWVVLCILVRFPFASRLWALPVLVALYRSKKWNKKHNRRHHTPPELMRRLLALLLRWFPDRKFVFAGDGNFNTHELARFAHKTRAHLTLVTRTAHWYRAGEGLVPVRWVFVHDLTGTHRDEYFFSTDIEMTSKAIIETYTGRWNIETTFQEARAHLGLESTRGWTRNTVLRAAPCLLGLYSVIALLYASLPTQKTESASVNWHGKNTITFSDAITAVRRWLWTDWVFETSGDAGALRTIGRQVREVILYALAPAA